jgi:hypothetical protein
MPELSADGPVLPTEPHPHGWLAKHTAKPLTDEKK